jgi:hypothetical protein
MNNRPVETAVLRRQCHPIIMNLPSGVQLGSSFTIVSGYGLHDRAIEVRSSAEARDFFSSLCVPTGSGAHPAFCTMGTAGSFPRGVAQPWRDGDWSFTPSSIEIVNE